MRKTLLTSFACATLSLVLGLGTVMVGAAETKSSISANETVKTVPEVAGFSKGFDKELSTKKKATAKAIAVQSVTAKNLWNVTDWNNFANNKNPYYVQPQTTSAAGYTDIATVKVGVNGSVFIPFYVEYNGTATSSGMRLVGNGNTYYGTQNYIFKSNLPAGTYSLQTNYQSANVTVEAKYDVAAISNQSNRWLSATTMCVASTGGNNYQYFKLSKRGVAKFYTIKRFQAVDGDRGVSSYIQQKSGSSWKTITTSNYATSFAYGLSAGTYRLVTTATADNILFLANSNKSYSSSYATKKKKAKTIKRKKSKTATMLVTSKTNTSHWYKVKVSKTRNTYIDVTNDGTSGNLYVTITGKTRLKSKSITNGRRFYGKAKKGTYYIKITKYSKNASGAYKVKYTK